MKKYLLPIGLLGMFVAVLLLKSGFPFIIDSSWSYTNMANGSNNGDNYGYAIPAVAVGDANNDGLNETVIGYNNNTNELRIYNYTGGIWTETNITDEPGGIYAVVIGDVNGDGLNEIVVGMKNNGPTTLANSIRTYENISGGWIETNVTSMSRDVTSIALGYAMKDGINGIMVGFTNTSTDGYNVKFYQNKTGTWAETNISTNPYDVAAVAIGKCTSFAGNATIVGFTNSFNGLRSYTNTTGKWVELNISKYDVAQTYPTSTTNIRLVDVDNDGKCEVVLGMSYNDGAITMNQVKNYRNLATSVWTGAVMAGGLTSMPTAIGVGDYYGNGKNATVYVIGTMNMIGITNISSSYWQQNLISIDLAGVNPNALVIADAYNNGHKEIVMGESVYGAPYNVFKALEYHYTPVATSGGTAAANYQCYGLGDNNYEYCISGSQRYFCLNIGGNKQCVAM